MSEYWERLPNETNKAYSAFCVYRDLRHDRSFTRVQAKLGKKSRTYIAYWSKKYKWVERVRAFDDYEEKLIRQKHIESIQKMNERQSRQSKAFQKVLYLPVVTLLKRLKKNSNNKISAIEDLNKLNTLQLIELIGQISKNYSNLVNTERIARGAPTEIGKSENTLIIPEQNFKYGEIVANDEKAAEALLKFLDIVGGTQKSKSSNDGNVCNEDEISDTSTY